MNKFSVKSVCIIISVYLFFSVESASYSFLIYDILLVQLLNLLLNKLKPEKSFTQDLLKNFFKPRSG